VLVLPRLLVPLPPPPRLLVVLLPWVEPLVLLLVPPLVPPEPLVKHKHFSSIGCIYVVVVKQTGK
jgi:hypothetical protein